MKLGNYLLEIFKNSEIYIYISIRKYSKCHNSITYESEDTTKKKIIYAKFRSTSSLKSRIIVRKITILNSCSKGLRDKPRILAFTEPGDHYHKFIATFGVCILRSLDLRFPPILRSLNLRFFPRTPPFNRETA